MPIHAQAEKPCRFFLGGLGLGIGVWQRQQTSLSSGFQVLQFGQFIRYILGLFIAAILAPKPSGSKPKVYFGFMQPGVYAESSSASAIRLMASTPSARG